MSEPEDARLVDIVRHGAGAPELNMVCCDDMDLEVDLDPDDFTVWEISCKACLCTICFVIDRHSNEVGSPVGTGMRRTHETEPGVDMSRPDDHGIIRRLP